MLSEEDLIELLKHFQDINTCRAFFKNTKLAEFTVKTVGFGDMWFWIWFKESGLKAFLESKNLIKKLLDKNLILNDELVQFLSLLTTPDNISLLAASDLLMKHLYAEHLLNREQLEKFNQILLNYTTFNDHLKNKDFFGYVDFFAQHYFERGWNKRDVNDTDQFLLSMNDVYRRTYKFEQLTFDERNEIVRLCKISEKPRNILNQIATSNLENQYSFDQLKDLLTKDDNKKKQKLNF